MVAVANRNSETRLLCTVFFLVALIACILNLDSTFIREIYLSGRIAIPVTILIGVIGSVQKARLLSTISTAVAWMGISWFLLAVIGTIVPDESIRLTNTPEWPNVSFLVIRSVVLLTIGILVAVAFRKLRAARAAQGLA